MLKLKFINRMYNAIQILNINIETAVISKLVKGHFF